MLTEEGAGSERAGDYACVAKTDPDDDHGSRRKLWVPFFLRRSTMIIFLLSSLPILGVLIALFIVTQYEGHSHGIKTDGERYYYLWTYGPTAVFTILTAGWLQVEYRATQLMPWFLMLNGPTPASQSILLDYISKWNVISLYQSLKQRHFLVSLAVAGSLILNGVTVFSTGLFELDSVPITRPVRMIVPQTFNTTGFDPSRNDAGSYASCSTIAISNTSRSFGIHEPYVYTPFQPDRSYSSENETIPAGVNYQANIQVLEPLIECQNATVTWGKDIGTLEGTREVGENTTVWSTPDGCHYEVDAMDAQAFEPFYTLFYLRGCHGETPGSEIDGTDEWGYTGPLDQSADWRLLVGMVGNSTIKNSTTRSGLISAPLYHVSSCKAHYTVYEGPVRIWRDFGHEGVSAEIDVQRLSKIDEFPNVLAANILYSAFQGLRLAQGHYGFGIDGGKINWLANSASFTGHLGGNPEIDWNDMAGLMVPLQHEMLCLMRQTILHGMVVAEPQHVEGTEQPMEDRLFVRPLSFWLMASFMLCLIIIEILFLCFFVPISVCPRDLASIGGMSSVFAESPEFMALFDGSDVRTETQMANRRLGQTQYVSNQLEGRFRILTHGDPSPSESIFQKVKPSEDHDGLTWWYPFASSWFPRIAVIALPLAVIIALEVVYHISSSSQGITLVDGKSPYIHYIWAYVPALIMFIIRCFFSSIEFGTRIIQPYSQLREGSAPPETTIFENQLRKIAVFGVFDTFQKKQWALAAATTSLLLAAINPIAVSGLYTVKPMGRTFPVNMTQGTRWNLGNTTNKDGYLGGYGLSLEDIKYANIADSNTKKTAGLIIQNNLSDPDWTYNNLAFPKLILSNTSLLQTGSINARVPALRSRLTCSEVPKDQLKCETFTDELHYFWCQMKEASCQNEEDAERMGVSKNWDTYSSSTEYFIGGSDTFLNPHQKNKSCPTHQIIYGRWTPDLGPLEYYYLRCTAIIEEVDTETTFQLPSLSIDTDSPPRIISGSKRTIFNASVIPYPGISDLEEYLFQGNSKLNDYLLDALVNGMNGVPMHELLDHTKLVAEMNEVWGTTMAQLFNSNGRESFHARLNTEQLVHPATSHAPIYEGTVHDGRKYLVQNKVSTRILDGVLASMVICAIIALCMIRTKEVLPKSPCSIASVASLVVGSRFLKTMKDTEWCTDKELKEKGLFESSFSMGWWKVEDDTMTSRPANTGPVWRASESLSRNDDGIQDENGLSSEIHSTVTTSSSTHSHSTEEKVRILTRFGIDMDETMPLLDHVQRSSVDDR
ncbi:hypothetical protein N7456_010004 [Penicillium angulare]|uniref:Uncharacterized protein n=1 Tax=Penicillium angulare TaxID=116970 RepID=A0A9W9F5S9_9EURO|nr:hypothetical protein N7456_010004 [Penicillium angulare]